MRPTGKARRWAMGIAMAAGLAGSPPASAQEIQWCRPATIVNVLAGPRHGAMIAVEGGGCGKAWICMDPDGENMSKEQSARAYSLAISLFLSKTPVFVGFQPNVRPAACRGYPLLEDLRAAE